MALEGLKEWFQLTCLGIAVRAKRIFEYAQVVYHYYGKKSFRRIDLALFWSYLFVNPYAISRHFAMIQGEPQIYTYGETPLTTLETIVKTCGITAQDHCFELGCGRGRSCFWLHAFIGCDVIGIEYNPYFTEKAQQIVEKLKLKGITFRCENLLETDYSVATVVYLYGTCLEDDFLVQLASKLKALPPGAKVITVSYPLTDYCYEPLFDLVDSFEAPFTWGSATVYLQRRKVVVEQEQYGH